MLIATASSLRPQQETIEPLGEIRACEAAHGLVGHFIKAPQLLEMDVRIHSGNNSKIIFLCICICYEMKINYCDYLVNIVHQWLPVLMALAHFALWLRKVRLDRTVLVAVRSSSEKIISKIMFICYVAPSKLQRTTVSVSATKN